MGNHHTPDRGSISAPTSPASRKLPHDQRSSQSAPTSPIRIAPFQGEWYLIIKDNHGQIKGTTIEFAQGKGQRITVFINGYCHGQVIVIGNDYRYSEQNFIDPSLRSSPGSLAFPPSATCDLGKLIQVIFFDDHWLIYEIHRKISVASKKSLVDADDILMIAKLLVQSGYDPSRVFVDQSAIIPKEER